MSPPSKSRRFPLEPLVRAAGAELRTGTVTALDADRKAVTLDGELGYERAERAS